MQKPSRILTRFLFIFGLCVISGQRLWASCSAPANRIVAENCLAGNPSSQWDIPNSGDPSIQGYATDFSLNPGQTVFFKIVTNATQYTIDIYRMGYYGGQGARKVASVSPSVTLPQSQPACITDAVTGLVDCGNWAVSASWAIPATAVSGIYFAKISRALVARPIFIMPHR